MARKYVGDGGNLLHFSYYTSDYRFLTIEQMQKASDFINDMIKMIEKENPDFQLTTPFGKHITDFRGNHKEGRKYQYQSWVTVVSYFYHSMSPENRAEMDGRNHKIMLEILDPSSKRPVSDEELNKEPIEVERRRAEVAKRKEDR